MRKLISSGSEYERRFGYSRAVVDGEWVFVSGTTGFDYATGEIFDDVVAQTERCFENIEKALIEANATMSDVVRARYYFTAAESFDAVAHVFEKWFGDVRPAATAIVCDLVDPKMKIEIEVTARLRQNVGG